MDRLLSALYDVVLAPDSMPTAMREIAKSFGATDTGVTVVDMKTFTIAEEHYWDGPEDDGLYERHFYRVDPRLQLVSGLPRGRIVRCQEFFDDAFVRRNEFYNEYLIPTANARYSIGAKVAEVGDYVAYLVLHRPPRSLPFSDDDAASFGELYPHVERATRMYLELREMRSSWRSEAIETVLGAVDEAFLIVDLRARIKICNPPAEAILRRSKALRVHNNTLHACASANDRGTLEQALQEAGIGRAASEMVIGQDTADPLLVKAIPLPAERDVATSPRILLSLRPCRSRLSLSPAVVGSVYRLTRAEARLVCALVRGQTLKEYAAGQGVAYGTVRSQLHGIFQKTGVSTQSHLIAMLSPLANAKRGGQDQGAE